MEPDAKNLEIENLIQEPESEERSQPDFFQAVANLKGSKMAFKLLRRLFRLEKGDLADEMDMGIVVGPGSPLSQHCRIAKRVLECVPKVVREKDKDGNILHALCSEGTGTMAIVVLGAMTETAITNYLRQPHRGIFPTTLAVNGNDISLLRLIVSQPKHDDSASRDDGRRKDHILAAVKNRNLPFLRVLLEQYDDNQNLLSDAVFTAAAESGDMEVWNFLEGENADLAKDPRLLAIAVEHRRLPIVRHILENNPKVFEDQAQLAKTTNIAVTLARDIPGTLDAEAMWDRKLSIDIEDLVLDSMVRKLNPAVVKACWPHDEGRAAKEVSLELDLRRPRNWTWFAQIVETAKSEVDAWRKEKDEEAKRREETRMRGEAARLAAEAKAMNGTQEGEEGVLAQLMVLLKSVNRSVADKTNRILLEAVTRIQAHEEGLGEMTLEEVEGHSKIADISFDGESTVENGHDGSEPHKSPDLLAGPETSDPPTPGAADVGSDRSGMQTPEEADAADRQDGGTQAHHASLLSDASPYHSRYNVEFQPYLKSVSIPDLDQFRSHESAQRISHVFGNEVKHILHWLRFVKGVRKILKLRVLDSRQRPHSEEAVEEATKDLHIEELDWTRLDLSTRAIQDTAGEAHTLHLYASGSWMPICQWTGTQGLEALTVRPLVLASVSDCVARAKMAVIQAVKDLYITIIRVSIRLETAPNFRHQETHAQLSC